MAIKKVYALQDKAANAYCQPFCFNTEVQALRAMEDLVSDPSTNPSKYPSDYSLYETAEFDEHTGIMIGHQQPKLIVELIQVKFEIERKTAKQEGREPAEELVEEYRPNRQFSDDVKRQARGNKL